MASRPEHEREEFSESLDNGPMDPSWEQAWGQEIARRVADVTGGRVALIDADEVHDELRAELRDPRRAMRSRDTTLAAHQAQMECYRRMTPAARVAVAVEMSEDTRKIAAAGIRERHPTYSSSDVRHALLRLLLGDELFRRGWPVAPLLTP